MRRVLGSLRSSATEAGAAVADFGTLLPIAAALVLVNGVDAVAAFGVAGLLFVVSGLVYRVPVPVQPIKAAAAIAIATGATPRVIAAAGLAIGAILVLLWATRAAPLLARLFPKTIIRGNQLGVGILLVIAAVQLAAAGEGDVSLVVAALLLPVVVLGYARGLPAAFGLVAAGVVWTLWTGDRVPDLPFDPGLPTPALPSWGDLSVALTLLVIPQIPLTLGNAIVGAADLEREYYGERAHRVTPGALCATSGAANLLAGLSGGMPLCHGSSGATAYYRAGARTGTVGVVAGSLLLVVAVGFGGAAPALLGLIPPAVLAALLAYTGLRHALLVADLRGAPLGIALAMGLAGGVTRNLAVAMAVGLPAYVGLALVRRRRERGAGAPDDPHRSRVPAP